MPTFTRGETSLYYEVHGSGPPLLLLAPGGMRSSIAFWERTPFHPASELSGQCRVIAMDQRNAGASRAPVGRADGWHTYAEDQLALLDELRVERCHLLGCCIGSAFALRLIAMAPERVISAVLEQPIGFDGTNRGAFHAIFDGWAEELCQARPDVSPEALTALKATMYDGEFVFSVSREDVARCALPLLVLRGDDPYHPAAISEEIARIAPLGELVQHWKTGDDVGRALARVRAFFQKSRANVGG